MDKLQLNTDKIQKELDRIGKNRAWLATQMGNTQAMVNYLFDKKPLSLAPKLARIFNMDAKDLIK
jgi:hypothetical protein